jgi:hypothetical protein
MQKPQVQIPGPGVFAMQHSLRAKAQIVIFPSVGTAQQHAEKVQFSCNKQEKHTSVAKATTD